MFGIVFASIFSVPVSGEAAGTAPHPSAHTK